MPCSHKGRHNARCASVCPLAKGIGMRFNLRPAICASFASAMVGVLLNQLGVPPTFRIKTSSGLEYNGSIHCQVLGAIGFIVTLALWKEGFACTQRETRVFLDKTCIHQEDPVLKARGILKLGAFLRSSRQMLVLLTPMYFKKLWTTYEDPLRPSTEAPLRCI